MAQRPRDPHSDEASPYAVTGKVSVVEFGAHVAPPVGGVGLPYDDSPYARPRPVARSRKPKGRARAASPARGASSRDWLRIVPDPTAEEARDDVYAASAVRLSAGAAEVRGDGASGGHVSAPAQSAPHAPSATSPG